MSEWYEDRGNLITLVGWMADNGYSAEDLAYAVEKPWKYAELFRLAAGEVGREEIIGRIGADGVEWVRGWDGAGNSVEAQRG